MSVDAAADTRPDEVAIEVDECAVALEWGATDRVGFPLREGFPLSGTAEKSAHLRLVHATGVVSEMPGELRLDDEESDTPWITVVFPEPLDATSILRIYVSKTMPMFCANPVYVKSCAQFRDAPASPP